jgi:hypothetical protein
MRAQPPGPLQRTTPLTRNRIPALINPQFYRAQFAAQGNGPAPSLWRGKNLAAPVGECLQTLLQSLASPFTGFRHDRSFEVRQTGKRLGY